MKQKPDHVPQHAVPGVARAIDRVEAPPTAGATTPAPAKNMATVECGPAPPQAPNAGAQPTPFDAVRAPPSACIHLLIGPVGAGKSTFALELAREHAAIRLTLDEWMVVLFSRDRPDAGVMEWYVERSARCIEQIWTVAQAIIEAGADVVLEIGLLQRRERERFYERVSGAGKRLAIYVLDAERDVRRERVNERNRERGSTFSMLVPPAIFELASDLWEAPEPTECDGRHVRFIRTDVAATPAEPTR